MTPQHWTTGPGATLPGPVAALILVAVVVLFAAGLCGHATQPPPSPLAALRQANRRRNDPDATEHPPRRPHGHTEPAQHRSST